MPSSTRNRIKLFFLSIWAGGSCGEAAEIRFKPQADVRGSLVLLGDLAEVVDSDGQLADKLKRIELFPAPARGRIRSVRDVEIRQLIQLHGIVLSEHQFSGAELVCIAHAKTPIAAPAPIAANSKTTEENQVVVAKQAIAAGSVIRAIDVELKAPDRAIVGGSSTNNPELVLGQETSRSYAVGQVVDPRSLRKPILVRRGEVVAVVAKAAGVRVRTTAKALSDGGLGDLLTVESDDRKKYEAVVIGLRQAEVFASGTSVTDSTIKVSKQPASRLK
jgi:flagella basal body P-ring formation protein FlgA